METLKIKVEGREIKIKYTARLAKGIFLVEDSKTAKNNCDLLKIMFDTPTDELEHQLRMTKIEKTGVLTTRVLGQYFQYILLSYAEQGDFQDLLRTVHPKDKEALTTVYNLARMNTVQDVQFLGGALDNKN